MIRRYRGLALVVGFMNLSSALAQEPDASAVSAFPMKVMVGEQNWASSSFLGDVVWIKSQYPYLYRGEPQLIFQHKDNQLLLNDRVVGLDLSYLSASEVLDRLERFFNEKPQETIETLLLSAEALEPKVVQRLAGMKPLMLVVLQYREEALDLRQLLPLRENLFGLYFKYSKVTEEDLPFIASFSNLRGLGIEDANLSSSGVAKLCALPELRDLNLTRTAIDGYTLSCFKDSSKLHSLELADTLVTDQSLQGLSQIQSLLTLNLSGSRVSDQGLQTLAKMANLRKLILNDSWVTSQGEETFSKLHPYCQLTASFRSSIEEKTDKGPTYSVGLATSYLSGMEQKAAVTMGVDLTLSSDGLIDLGPPIFWLSAGFRTRLLADDNLWLPYVEIGSWMVVSLGVGCSLALPAARPNFHLFLGLPVPFYVDDAMGVFYVEPFYRPIYGKTLDAWDWGHEGGLMLKWANAKGPFF